MTKVDSETFKKRRKALGLTQSQLSEIMGVSQQAISSWETGERNIPTVAWKLFKFVEASLTTEET